MATATHADLSDAFSKLSVNDENQQLIKDLIRLSTTSPKLVRSSEHAAPADPSIKIRSWKMNEFKYYDIPSPFPTLARGFFTREVEQDGHTRHAIVARGYDKFFNIGEVPWTTWASLEAHTKPPYTLTLKANGCIIFIAPLSPSKLVVMSKHSLGPVAGQAGESHAQVGERWLHKHLADAGKTEEQLAATLWKKNWTAVAELCDDSFEEHVLRITKENTGLHLHGLNERSKHFTTMLPDVVEAFAREWGFIVTPYTQLNTIPEVKEFTEKIGKEGKWRGAALEGFVVRTHVSEPPTRPGKDVSASPYTPGSSFFFKVKFDEPYMMYRDWREVTKILLSKGPQVANVPKGKLRRPETRAYVNWVIGEIKRDRKQFDQYMKGRGIIATRDRFLEWFASEQGRQELAKEEKAAARSQESSKKFGKTIIVPVAIPGVGKTTIAVALKHLFGFGHTQSDDVKGKKTAPQFIKNVVALLKTHDVVIADKNNHLRQHRQQLRDAVKRFDPPVRLMALNWSFDIPLSTVHRICGDRVLARGDMHQTLHGDAVGKSHEDVIWMFLQNAEELTEGEVDVSVEMNIEEPLEDALARAVDACVSILGVPKPTAEQMGEALAAARSYVPSTRTTDGSKKVRVIPPRYYALLPEIDLEGTLEKRLAEDDVPKDAVELFEELKKNKRLSDRPHVTLVHEKGLPDDQPLWDQCKAINEMPVPPSFVFKLGHVVWNDRIMAVTVSDLSASSDDDDADAKGVEFMAQLPAEVKQSLHITVGTKSKDVRPVEAKDVVARWREGEKNVSSCELKDVWVKGRVKGLHQ